MSIGSITSGNSFSSRYTSASCRACGDVEQSQSTPNAESTDQNRAAESRKANAKELSKEEQKQVSDLKKRDAEVRAHEAAHMGAGGGVVRGGATYSFQTGPDGGRYAVGGEVGIDTSAVKGNPQATISKMQQVRAAALAPASPSGQDRSVAAAASSTESSARMELAKEKGEKAPGGGEDKGGAASKEAQAASGYSRKGEKMSVASAAGSVGFDAQA